LNDLFLRNLHIEIYGGSHDEKIGVRLSGLPAGERFDRDILQRFLDRRAPSSRLPGTKRREDDVPVFLSGVDGDTLSGELLEAVIYNRDARPGDYPSVPDVPRPSHADYAAIMKYGSSVDLRGGGRFSGRLTAPLCVAGGIALQLLERRGVYIGAHIETLGGIHDLRFDPLNLCREDFEALRTRTFPVIDEAQGEKMLELIGEISAEGDSVGGVVECGAVGLPVGLGEHMFAGMENRIAHLAFGIPALKGIEFGAGFALSDMRGSEANDPFRTDGKRVYTTKNNSGGIQGGMTNGMPLIFRGVLKPTPSIALPQESVSLIRMENTDITISGRHDPAIPVRAVPVFEAVAALAILDAILDS